MLHSVCRLSIAIIVALCLVTFAFAQAQQQARPAGQAVPAAQAAKDYPEDHRPPIAFREDWTDPTPGVPTDYKDKTDYLDLSNPMAKVVWRTKQGGFRQLRLVLKLADGSFLISDRYAGPAEDWNISRRLD